MSTLTKVLIVLQTVFSIFLCGIVVTYVGNAANYKGELDDQRSITNRARSEKQSIAEDWEQFKTEKNQALVDASKQIETLTSSINGLKAQLATAEKDRSALALRVDGMGASVATTSESAEKQRQMYAEAQAKLDDLRAEQIRLAQDLKETNDVLIEKLAIIATQDEQLRRLTEEKTEISNRLENSLKRYGLAPTAATPVTAATASTAKPAMPMQNIALKGLITDLHLKDSLAEISIGSTAGLKQDMKLHVMRGKEFVCDITVLEVDAERAVGILNVVQSNPRIGDVVSTNF